MLIADLVTAALLAAVAGLVIFDALRIGIGWSTDGPRSGFFPFWLGVALLLACGVIALQALRRRWPRRFVTRVRSVQVLKVLAPAAGLVVLTQWIGLYVASALYIALSMRWIGRHGWVSVGLVAVGVPLVIFIVFETWFLVPMPKGPLERWLGY